MGISSSGPGNQVLVVPVVLVVLVEPVVLVVLVVLVAVDRAVRDQDPSVAGEI